MMKASALFFKEVEPQRVAGAVCRAASAIFSADSASLYRLDSGTAVVLARHPSHPAFASGVTFLPEEDPEVRRSLSSRHPFIVPVLPHEGQSQRVQEVSRLIGSSSALAIPVNVGTRGDTHVVLGWREQQEPPDSSRLELARRFSDQVALALAHGEAVQLHNRLEAGLMPRRPVAISGLDIFSRFWLQEQRLLFGGDFFGVLQSSTGAVHILVGDVSGHGPDAAALGAGLRSAWRALAALDTNLGSVLDSLHSLLLTDREDDGVFATIFVARLDLEQGRLEFVDLGHPPPILIGETTAFLPCSPMPPLGFLDLGNEGWPATQVSLSDDWQLFLFTDGLYEGRIARHAEERFGLDRLLGWVLQTGRVDESAIDAFYDQLKTASGGSMPDDIAVLVLTTSSVTEAPVIPGAPPGKPMDSPRPGV